MTGGEAEKSEDLLDSETGVKLTVHMDFKKTEKKKKKRRQHLILYYYQQTKK
jgi:hypothetical protein